MDRLTAGTEKSSRIKLLRRAILPLPRTRLATIPTPLEYAPRLTAALRGPRIYIKRDDLTGLALGGNKTRMFDFVLGKAIQDGCDTVVGGAAVQSNYSRQLAAGCAKLGLECHLVLRRVREGSDDEVQGSLLVDLLVGAHVHLCADDRSLQRRLQLALAEDLTQRGRRVYLARSASEGDKALHGVAFVEAAAELEEQAAGASIDVNALYVASLDTTLAGLVVGLKAVRSAIQVRSFSPTPASIWPGKSIQDEAVDLANEIAALLSLPVTVDPSDVDISTDYSGSKYGAVTQEALDAIRLFGTQEGILLDPVYTAKAAVALIDHCRRGIIKSDDTVVFWHTGGQAALFAYSRELGLAAPDTWSSATNVGV